MSGVRYCNENPVYVSNFPLFRTHLLLSAFINISFSKASEKSFRCDNALTVFSSNCLLYRFSQWSESSAIKTILLLFFKYTFAKISVLTLLQSSSVFYLSSLFDLFHILNICHFLTFEKLFVFKMKLYLFLEAISRFSMLDDDPK